MRKKYLSIVLFSLATTPVSAATVFDPSNDFISGFIGTNSPDLDVTSFSADYNSTTNTFLLGAALAGAINTAVPGFYIIGVNTGAGAIAPFADIGQPSVTFDQAVRVNKDGTGSVGATALAAGSVTIVGNLFTASVPASLLISTGLIPENYGFNIWPRIGFGNNNQISDFAPDDALLRVGVPEISTWTMMLLGIWSVGLVMRRRRSAGKSLRPFG